MLLFPIKVSTSCSLNLNFQIPFGGFFAHPSVISLLLQKIVISVISVISQMLVISSFNPVCQKETSKMGSSFPIELPT